jgi:hypothetical protein
MTECRFRKVRASRVRQLVGFGGAGIERSDFSEVTCHDVVQREEPDWAFAHDLLMLVALIGPNPSLRFSSRSVGSSATVLLHRVRAGKRVVIH